MAPAVSSRIEVELTSARDDGTWTWRAAGAREPRGVLDSSVLYEGAKVGDVVRAEAEFEIDGITISSVQEPRARKGAPEGRIELLGPGRDQALVTTSLAGRKEGRKEGRRDKQGRRREDKERRRREGPPGPSERAERRRPAEVSAGGGSESPGRRERRQRPEGAERAGRRAEARPRRLAPRSVHREAVMESLSPEQRPVAEQLVRGGLPAVRQALEEQNRRARAEGRPEVKSDALIGMAEELLPMLKAATWRDRADAAARDMDGIGLRDLRSVVAGSESAARDDESRALAETLRKALDRRVTVARSQWVDAITAALDEGRLVRALHLSSKPPEPSSRVPADLAVRLRDAAGEAMSPGASPERWLGLLEAVLSSPVRRVVKPAGLPAGAGPELAEAARRASGQVPGLARILGIGMPPPPGPRRGHRPGPGSAQVPTSR